MARNRDTPRREHGLQPVRPTTTSIEVPEQAGLQPIPPRQPTDHVPTENKGAANKESQ
jgi:hypothetical protein